MDKNSVNLPLLIYERDNFIFLTGLVPAGSEVPNDQEIDCIQRSMKTFFWLEECFLGLTRTLCDSMLYKYQTYLPNIKDEWVEFARYNCKLESGKPHLTLLI